MRRLRLSSTAAAVLALGAVPAAGAQTGGATYSDADVTLTTTPHALVGKTKRFAGTAPAGRAVTVERYDQIQSQWTPIAYATATADGVFRTRWKPDRAGAARVRARVTSSGARAASTAPALAITVFTPAKATWYGPGFYGRTTACGKRMTKTLVGVAHKTLRCGRKVTFLYKGRTLTVRVVDRGPYVDGVRWDLTSAAAQQLGFEHTDSVGALTR